MDNVIFDRYAAVADMIFAGDLGKLPARLDQLFPDNENIDRDYIGSKMIGLGATLLGQGSFSIVFQVPGIDGVVKMTHDRTDKWSIYAKYAMEHHETNPMLPKVFELYEHNGWCVARMELLHNAGIEHSIGMLNVVKAVRSPIFGLSCMTRKRKHDRIGVYLNKWFDLRWCGGYSRTHLADIVIWLAGKGSKVNIDCHGKNWMQRNMQLVLTDPIF